MCLLKVKDNFMGNGCVHMEWWQESYNRKKWSRIKSGWALQYKLKGSKSLLKYSDYPNLKLRVICMIQYQLTKQDMPIVEIMVWLIVV